MIVTDKGETYDDCEYQRLFNNWCKPKAPVSRPPELLQPANRPPLSQPSFELQPKAKLQLEEGVSERIIEGDLFF